MRRKGTPIGPYGSDLDFGVPFPYFNIAKELVSIVNKGKVSFTRLKGLRV